MTDRGGRKVSTPTCRDEARRRSGNSLFFLSADTRAGQRETQGGSRDCVRTSPSCGSLAVVISLVVVVVSLRRCRLGTVDRPLLDRLVLCEVKLGKVCGWHSVGWPRSSSRHRRSVCTKATLGGAGSPAAAKSPFPAASESELALWVPSVGGFNSARCLHADALVRSTNNSHRTGEHASRLLLAALGLLGNNLQSPPRILPRVSDCPWPITHRERDKGTHALDDLGLLDQERADNAVADAGRAARATVRALDGLLPLRDLRVLARAEGRDLCRRVQSVSTVARGGSRGRGERDAHRGGRCGSHRTSGPTQPS